LYLALVKYNFLFYSYILPDASFISKT